MERECAYRYRIYPNPAQKVELARTFGAARFVYNWALRMRTDALYERGERLSYVQSSAALTALKQRDGHAWMNDLSSVPMQQALRHRGQVVHPRMPVALFQGGQGGGGLHVAESLATLVQRIRSHSQRPVVDEAGSTKRAGQLDLLGRIRIDAIAIGAFTFHISQYITKRVRLPCLPMPEARGFLGGSR